jgi:hypothetical protein
VTFIRIVGLYLGVVPPTCILVLSILWFFYSIFYILSAIMHIVIDRRIHCLMCVDTYLLNRIHFPL